MRYFFLIISVSVMLLLGITEISRSTYIGGGNVPLSLNGLTVDSQTFATGTGPFGFISDVSVHTLNIPLATSNVTGLLQGSDWTTFNAKSTSTGANPTASVGLSAVNGTANTFLRSDGVPALSVSIAPTWTGLHIFNSTTTFNAQITVGSSTASRCARFDAGKNLVAALGDCASGDTAGTAANPTATIGLSAINGLETTYMRSDAAPALSQAIQPTWSALHTFQGGTTFTATSTFASSTTITGRFNFNNYRGSTPTNGQILIGNATDFTLATMTQGAGLVLTNASGSITWRVGLNGDATQTCGGTDKVSSISATGTIACATDQTGGGGGTWTTVQKTADEVINSDATLSVDAVLKFTTVANTQYRIHVRVVQNAGNAAADFKYRMTHGGTTTRVIRRIVLGAGDNLPAHQLVKTTFDAADVALLDTVVGANIIEETILLQVGASGGELAFQWAQNTSTAGANTTVYEGSYLEYATF